MLSSTQDCEVLFWLIWKSEAILLQWIPRDCTVLPWQWSSESISSSWCFQHEVKFISLYSVHSYHTFSTTQIVNCLVPTSLVNSTCKDPFACHLFPQETPILKLSLSCSLGVSIFFPKMQLKLMASLLLSPHLLPSNIYYLPYSSRAHTKWWIQKNCKPCKEA